MLDRKELNITTAADPSSAKIGLGRRYARLLGFRARLTGTDTSIKIKITDADSRVVYLDAADADYKTAAVDKMIVWDDTATGLSTVVHDATGASAAAGEALAGAFVHSPLTITISDCGTATDVVNIKLYVDLG